VSDDAGNGIVQIYVVVLVPENPKPVMFFGVKNF